MVLHRLKSLALAAAFVSATAASGLAQADILTPSQLIPGLGTWELSHDGLTALEAGAITISTPIGYTGHFNGVDKVNVPFSSIVMPQIAVEQRLSVGPTFDLNRTVVKQGVATLDRTLAVSDLSLNVATASITAHVLGKDKLTNVTDDYGVITLFALGQPNSPVDTSAWGQMHLTNLSADVLMHVFDLPTGTSIESLYRSPSWGTFSTSAVPEPGSCALMLMGLTGLLVTMRQRRKA